MVKFFINPGHGGKDPGKVSANGLKESEICANIAEILAKRMKLNGYQFKVYQQKDSLYDVSKESNKYGADIFISIHCNSAVDPKANGTETWYYKYSIKGEQIAKVMQEELIRHLGLRDRGIKSNETFHVLKRTNACAILIETAFLSNPKEEKFLKENQEKIANAIWEGIKKIKDM